MGEMGASGGQGRIPCTLLKGLSPLKSPCSEAISWTQGCADQRTGQVIEAVGDSFRIKFLFFAFIPFIMYMEAFGLCENKAESE